MAAIDADAHVLEAPHTWDYLEPSERDFRPRVVMAPAPGGGPDIEWWEIDGYLRPKGTNVGEDTPEASREMKDVALRLHHMDELGVDVQVLYPSIFLSPLTQRPAVERALCRSYNRWMADIWALGKDRLRWAAVLPLMNMDAALTELEWCRERGACAVFIRGLEGERRLTDPYFFPLYDRASDLDVPICIHSANGNFATFDLYEGEAGFSRFKMPNVGAFHSIVFTRLPEQFPKLRWGFIEISAQWVPYVIHDLRKRYLRLPQRLPDDILGDYRIWVACQTDDDLPYVLQYAGEDRLVIGSDYGHADTATEIEALRRLKEHPAVNPRVIDKILDDNARALYSL
jgi:predicted TIM-barrel fold metal-dependent hydrolase